MDSNMDLPRWSINFLIKKSSAMRAPSETLATQNTFAGSEIISNKELAEELH